MGLNHSRFVVEEKLSKPCSMSFRRRGGTGSRSADNAGLLALIGRVRSLSSPRQGLPVREGKERENDDLSVGAGRGFVDFEWLGFADQDSSDVVEEVDQEDEGDQSPVSEQCEPGEAGEEELLESPLGEDGDDVLAAFDIEVDAGDGGGATVLAEDVDATSEGDDESEEEVELRDPGIAPVGFGVVGEDCADVSHRFSLP